ncbi:DUF1992 domain-containing protein [Mesobacterium pallidum]|uniref:DnaJ family domain-containing protein n=1 Tax=Mesobacterium pallidum TaxID=2872037 RepID=UPI001EE15DE9|nr:DUF1992 domain-containing protein [Mesobacterium pallidum]
MRGWRTLVERQIRKAEAEGKLSGLAGEGKPLPHRPGDALIDAADAAGFRIMAEAGALPEEIRLKTQLDEARAAWSAEPDAAARKPLMARVADLQVRYEIAREARRKFLR